MDNVKKLGFGMMRLPLNDEENKADIDFAQTCQMVDTFLERGFTYFDTAYMYHLHQSEIVLREALVKRHDRTSFTVTSKLPLSFIKTTEDNERIFNEQLEKCGVDYFDYYLLHNVSTNTYKTAKNCDCFAFISRMKEEGKIRHIGFSYHDGAELLDEILTAHPEIEVVQLQLNYLDWDNPGIQSEACYETVKKHGKKVIVMEPVKGGMLANVPEEVEKLFHSIHPDMSAASWAIRYAASHEEVMMVLSGMSNMEQLLDNTGYMQEFKPLTEEEFTVIKQAVGVIRSSIEIQCTACRYCVDGCPKKIAIPEYFSLYNLEKQVKSTGFSNNKMYYNTCALTHGKASDCINCGKCEIICPQHLKIREHLKNVAEVMEA